jgi:3-oxoacyl-[acyl-carrier-protein] synthase II
VRLALADAGLGPEQIGYVNAHATSTPAGDIAELRALAAAGLQAAPISSTKSLHGHALGAAGGIEAVAALMAFGRDVLPAGANINDPETDPPADLIRTPRAARIDALLSNSFGFGGHNAALVFSRA